MLVLKKLFFTLFSIFVFVSFTMGQYFIVDNIKLEGNNKTKDKFILRELLFFKGDTIKLENWERIKQTSEQNLVNTSLFHFANISVQGDGVRKQVLVKLKERWYLWPIPQIDIDERNFNTWWETKSLNRASVGVFLTHNNMRGNGELLKVLLMLGYNKKVGLSYEFPYLNKKKTLGFGFQSIYTLRHEVNALTKNDKQLYLKTVDFPIQEDWISSFQLTYRPKFYLSHLLQFRFHQWRFADTLLHFNTTYSPNSNKELNYFGLYYKLKLDHRDYKPYPLRGYYADIEIFKYGLGLTNSDLNILSFKSTLRKYWQLGKRWYYAAGIIGKISNNAFQPYLLERGLGYGRDFVRGYEYYVVDGQNYMVAKTNIKFALLPEKIVKLNWIKSDKFNTIPYAFYLNMFCDMGYVYNSQAYSSSNQLPNSLQYSIGLGLDFISYYDAVARLEWTVNAWGESSFYVHFIAPI